MDRMRFALAIVLSAVVLIAAAAEFVMVKQAATATFAILSVMCLVDFIGGIAVSVRVSRRMRTVGKVEAPRRVAEPAHFIPEVSPLSREAPPSSHAVSPHPPDSSHPTS